MKNFLFAALATLVLQTSLHADEFFQDCETVIDNNSYQLLNKYFTSNDVEAVYCQQLSESELLYTDNFNFYYCKVNNKNALSCESSEQSAIYPNLSVIERFYWKGKQFVLFKVSRMSHGNFGEGYHVFYLVPKRVAARGYVIQYLDSAGPHDNNDASGECGPDDIDVVVALDPPVQILNKKQGNVAIRFNQEKTNCKTGDRYRQTLEYTWQPFSFQKTLDKQDKLPAKH